MVAGNISAGKSTLGQLLNQHLPESIYIEEKFKELKLLPLYYDECQSNLQKSNRHNKYALDLQLEFLENRFENELFRNGIHDKKLILDRCIYEDFHIFTKSQLELGSITRIFESRRFFELSKDL